MDKYLIKNRMVWVFALLVLILYLQSNQLSLFGLYLNQVYRLVRTGPQQAEAPYKLSKTEWENNRVPATKPLFIFRQIYISSEKELDIETFFRPYLDNYLDDNGDIQENVYLVIIDDTIQTELQENIERGVKAKARNLGVEDKVFYLPRERDLSWARFEEGFMRKIGRVLFGSYAIMTGRNTSKMYTAEKWDQRERDRQGNIKILNGQFYIRNPKADDPNAGLLLKKTGLLGGPEIVVQATQIELIEEGDGKFRLETTTLDEPIKEENLDFRNVYRIGKDGNLYDSHNNLLAEAGQFAWEPETRLLTYPVRQGSRVGEKLIRAWYAFLIDELGHPGLGSDPGDFWWGSKNLGKQEFIGKWGRIFFDEATNAPVMYDGKFIRGNYIGINFRRDPDAPLFRQTPDVLEALEALHSKWTIGATSVIIDLDTDPAGDLISLAEYMAPVENQWITILVPGLDISYPYRSFYINLENAARETLTGPQQAEWDIFGAQSAGKYLANVGRYLRDMLGLGDDWYDLLMNDTWESGNEVVPPDARSEDLHETTAGPTEGGH